MNVFDIVGPVMIGPSSSHTAGACRIGNYARAILNEEPMKATIQFSGSFKTTYKGHGTDKALIAGLMGFKTDDIRLRDSIEIAKNEGRDFNIITQDIELAHPNTALIIMTKKNGEKVIVQGASIGGGNIMLTRINDVNVEIKGLFDALIVGHKDIPGMIYKITRVLFVKEININSLSLHRIEKTGDSVAIIEVDNRIEDSMVKEIEKIKDINNVIVLHALE